MAPRFPDYDPSLCLNCGRALETSSQYCTNCGQRNRRHKRSLFEWLVEGLSSLFHIEGKSWNTIRDIPIPGKYVVRYLSGQRQRYVHPLRLLLLCSIVFFASIQLLGGDGLELVDVFNTETSEEPSDQPSINLTTSDAEREALRNGTSAPTESAQDLPEIPETPEFPHLPGLEQQIDDAVQEFASGLIDGASGEAIVQDSAELKSAILAEAPQLRLLSDLLDKDSEDLLDDTLQLAKSKMRIIDQFRMNALVNGHLDLYQERTAGLPNNYASDSLTTFLRSAFPKVVGIGRFSDSNDITQVSLLQGEQLDITPLMLVSGDPKEIAEASNLKNPFNRVLAQKIIRLFQEGGQSVNAYLFSQLSWAILLFVPLLGFVYKLWYWRKMKFYTQHLTYAAVLVSVALILGTFGVILMRFGFSGRVFTVLALVHFVYALLGDIKLYQTAWWKAFLKNVFGISLFGGIAFGIAAMLWMFGVFLAS